MSLFSNLQIKSQFQKDSKKVVKPDVEKGGMGKGITF